MRRSATSSVFACLLLIGGFGFAEDQPGEASGAAKAIEEKLEEAKSAYVAARTAARETLIKAIQKRVDELSEAGNLEAVEPILAQLEMFRVEKVESYLKDYAELPTEKSIKGNSVTFKEKLKAAKQELQEAFVEAKKAYTMITEYPKAKAASEEANLLVADMKALGEAGRAPRIMKKDLLQEGTLWSGSLIQTWNRSKVETVKMDAELHILERNKNAFRGRLSIDDGSVIREMVGFILNDGTVGWWGNKSVITKGMSTQFDYVGRIEDDIIRLSFGGINNNNVPTYGHCEMKLNPTSQ